MRTMEVIKAEVLISEAFEWSKWIDEIPYIKWPSDWLVKAVPPYNGAIVRYLITKDGLEDNVSVYLDCYGALGSYDEGPYWEIYPHEDDVYRCGLLDIAGLLRGIEHSLFNIEHPKADPS